MKSAKILFMAAVVLLVSLSAAYAGDYDWMKKLNIEAQADPSGFRAQLAARFKIGDAEISAVIGNVKRPADAYMVFRLGEMSRQPADHVLAQYRSGKSSGWGSLAKSLGIKPGSREFHALKRGHDLYRPEGQRTGKGKGREKEKEKKKA